MVTIESKKIEVSHSPLEVFHFLRDINNLEKLMPKDRVEHWQSTSETCRFSIKNLATIGMKVKDSVPGERIILESDGKNPFPFELTIFIGESNQKTQAYFVFSGEVNMFMATMVKTPLKNFFDQLADQLPEAM
jgi:carbon monoxide dehydrogenase subunit G